MKGHRPDYILIIVTAVLLILGVLILASVSASLSQERFGNTFYFLNHQLLFGFLPGVILAFLAFRIRLETLKKWAPVLLLISLVLLIIIFLPKIGAEARGAARWISIGPISFQPSEFLKLTFILYLAAWLTSRAPDQRKSGSRQAEKGFSQTLIAFLIVIIFVSLLLIFQPDISTLGVIVASAILMYFLASTPLWHSILIIFGGILSLFAIIKLAPYRINRLLVFLNPEIDPTGIGYQIKQALIAIGSGGIFGLGLGLGMFRQKIGFLPHSISDSIFAIFAEETGFIGSFILVLLYLAFFWRGLKIGKQSADKFSKFCAFGITFWITLQAFVNIGSMIGILPLTGIPLPFISYGGSALISELVGVGVLLNISKNTN